MFKDRVKIYQAYHSVISIALTWAVVLVINRYFDLRVPFWLGFIYCLIPAVLIYLFNAYRKNGISYLLLVSIVPALALVFWATKTNPIILLNNILEWCRTYDWSDELYVAGYAHFLVFAAAVISSILFYLLTIKQLTKILLGIVLFVALILLSVYGFDINKVVVAICFLYILTIILEFYEKIYTRKAGRAEKKEGMLYLVPICLLLAVLSVVFPAKPEPIQWKVFKQMYDKISEQIEDWKVDLDYMFSGKGSEFAISMTGYSEDSGKLNTGGRLVEDDKISLKISGMKKSEAVYLIGSVSDSYTGSAWEKNSTYVEGYDDYMLDFLELFYAMARQETDFIKDNRLVEWYTAKILYQQIKTKTFFHPGKMSYYSVYSTFDKIDAKNAQITFNKAVGKGTQYQAVFYNMNLQGEAFAQMLKNEDSFSYDKPEDINKITSNYLQFNTFRASKASYYIDSEYFVMLKERARVINEIYTGLPADLPERVYNLAYDLTKDYETKYEKLKAIETYLMHRYTYSTRSPRVPEGHDYVDYFLFDETTGYCTSFATAMAVLGRCIGIPTRYVEGYIARFDDPDEDKMYNVRSSNAHAWAEAYLEGVGWIPFEATAPYYSVRYKEWEQIEKDDRYVDEATEDYLAKQGQQNGPQITPQPTVIKKEEEKQDILKTLSGIIAALIIISVLIIAIVIYYNVLKLGYKRDFDKANYNDKIYMLFLRILRLLKKEGFEMSPDETVIMLAERVEEHFKYEGVSFTEVARIYMLYRYADEEIGNREYESVAAYQQGLANEYRSENNKLKVWLEELVFLSRRKAA